MMLNLYVFIPTRGWSYCGGAALVIDYSAAEAFRRLQGTDGYNDFNSYVIDESIDGDYGCWLLHSVFEVKKSKPRVVVVDYNWA